jgi:SAM-dependent methyltransferase
MPRLLAVLLLAALCVGVAAEEDDTPEASVLDLIAAKAGETVADVGCGTGTWTIPLARAVGSGGKVYAVDIDPDVIDHVDREVLAGFLDGIRRSLKPDGRMVIRDPNPGPDRVICECYRAGFALVEARVPLEGPSIAFASGWYALKFRRSEVQSPVLPRDGRPARWRVRLHLAEELFRAGLLSRDRLRAKWESVRDRPGPYDPKADETRDLVAAAHAVGVLADDEARALSGAPPR